MPPKKVQVAEKVEATSEVLPYLPFAEVIAGPQLMGGLWTKHLSLPQQVALKAFYGLPLEGRELDIWAIFNDQVTYDELGYPLSTQPLPYTPREYDQLVGILGRRSGKSSAITAFAALYEILFGGHLAYVKPGQDVVVPYIAQDLATAKANMIFIALMANDAPLLRKQILTASRDRIDFKNGIVVTPEPPAIKTGRGIAVPLVIMDEVGFWYRTAEAANPDYEVQRAVSFAQSQFPRAKQFIISTPYTEEGLLYEYWKAGTAGRHIDPEDRLEYEDALVIQSSTAAMENPVITRKKLQKLKNQDPDAFIRESLCRFVSAISGFFAVELVERATKGHGKGRTRSQNEAQGLRPLYVAAMDPAFRHDSFAFAIFHMDPDGTVVQDILKTWTPDSKRGERLDPATIIDEIAHLTKEWGISVVYSDQYQLEALQQLALRHLPAADPAPEKDERAGQRANRCPHRAPRRRGLRHRPGHQRRPAPHAHDGAAQESPHPLRGRSRMSETQERGSHGSLGLAAPAPRKRGRPRKHPVPAVPAPIQTTPTVAEASELMELVRLMVKQQATVLEQMTAAQMATTDLMKTWMQMFTPSAQPLASSSADERALRAAEKQLEEWDPLDQYLGRRGGRGLPQIRRAAPDAAALRNPVVSERLRAAGLPRRALER